MSKVKNLLSIMLTDVLRWSLALRHRTVNGLYSGDGGLYMFIQRYERQKSGNIFDVLRVAVSGALCKIKWHRVCSASYDFLSEERKALEEISARQLD